MSYGHIEDSWPYRNTEREAERDAQIGRKNRDMFDRYGNDQQRVYVESYERKEWREREKQLESERQREREERNRRDSERLEEYRRWEEYEQQQQEEQEPSEPETEPGP